MKRQSFFWGSFPRLGLWDRSNEIKKWNLYISLMNLIETFTFVNNCEGCFLVSRCSSYVWRCWTNPHKEHKASSKFWIRKVSEISILQKSNISNIPVLQCLFSCLVRCWLALGLNLRNEWVAHLILYSLMINCWLFSFLHHFYPDKFKILKILTCSTFFACTSLRQQNLRIHLEYILYTCFS